jgi:diguanylate cyclase (GGDEF)-like protein/PAS domain S-box-containing protein
MPGHSKFRIASARLRKKIEGLRLGSSEVARQRDRKLARLLQNHASAIVDSSDDAIFAKTLDGAIVSWNRAAERIYGYSASEIVGGPVSALYPPELHNELHRIMQKIKHGKGMDNYETVCVKKNGSRISVSVTISPILDARGKVLGASAIARDISVQKRSEESIRYAATHDGLTDLANSTALLKASREELRRSDRTGRPFALLLLDVDRLKEINDTYGHLVGTRALCRVAAILKDTCRSIDTAARYGGDEFVVLLVETTEALALSITQRIRDKLAKDDESPSLTVSIGVAAYPQDGHTVENLFAAADGALYKNKLAEHMHERMDESEILNQDTMTAVMDANRRRSPRRLLDMALDIRGMSKEAKPFQETTLTIDVSTHGVLLVLATKVELGDTLFLKNPDVQYEMEGRVVRFGSPYGGLAQVGIEFRQPAPEFWPTAIALNPANLE